MISARVDLTESSFIKNEVRGSARSLIPTRMTCKGGNADIDKERV